MGQSVQKLADELFVEPDDILALLELYPGEDTDLWEQDGVLTAEAAQDVSLMLNRYADSPVPELYLERPTGVFPLPSRVAWVGECALVHRGSVHTGLTKCGQPIARRTDGVTVSNDQQLCPKCFLPDY